MLSLTLVKAVAFAFAPVMSFSAGAMAQGMASRLNAPVAASDAAGVNNGAGEGSVDTPNAGGRS